MMESLKRYRDYHEPAMLLQTIMLVAVTLSELHLTVITITVPVLSSQLPHGDKK
jgi:hypothetical protein